MIEILHVGCWMKTEPLSALPAPFLSLISEYWFGSVQFSTEKHLLWREGENEWVLFREAGLWAAGSTACCCCCPQSPLSGGNYSFSFLSALGVSMLFSPLTVWCWFLSLSLLPLSGYWSTSCRLSGGLTIMRWSRCAASCRTSRRRTTGSSSS